MPSSDLSVRKGTSLSADATVAVDELREAIAQDDASVTLVFVGARFDLAALGPALRAAFPGPLLACTTSGEIAPTGYAEHSLTGASVSSSRLTVRTFRLSDLAELRADRLDALVAETSLTLADLRLSAPATRAFGLLLIDGLSRSEENVIAQVTAALGDIPVIGGSAGDGLRFERTAVFFDGKFESGTAVLAVFFTDLPFEVFKTDHFLPMEDKKLVITEADVERRIVREINGAPAAAEYARILGLDVSKLDSMVFSTYPLLLRIGGQYYVRSIQKVNADGSMTFFCAIDEGLVLTMSRGLDIVQNLERQLDGLEGTLPKAPLIIGCECVLRRLEIFEKGVQEQMGELMRRHNVIGFHTYGEQFRSLHINQTLIGVALGTS